MSQNRDVHKTVLFMLEMVQHHLAKNYQQIAGEAKNLSSVEAVNCSVSFFIFVKFFTEYFENF